MRLRHWFNRFTMETGEIPEFVVFGFDEGISPEADLVERWSDLPGGLCAWSDVPASVLDRDFDDGFGAVESPNLCAWSKSWVIFSTVYDGAEDPRWVPRHPIVHNPIRSGDG